MRFTIFGLLLLCSLFATEIASPSPKVDQKESPAKQIVEPTSDPAKNQRRHILDKIRKGVVIVKVKAHVKARNPESKSWSGSGFIVDKARGLIATNRHVAGSFSICSYELKFNNGSKVDARRLYVDPRATS